jgi:D-hydroxyproline dehydrogenase subunit gamma
MPTEALSITIDGQHHRVLAGTSVAVAIWIARGGATRRTVSGQLRGPLCGMGICFECRATVDGRAQRITCQTPCRDGMEVTTDAPRA